MWLPDDNSFLWPGSDYPVTDNLMVIGFVLFALGFSFGFAAGYIVRSAKSHRRLREAAALRRR